ncbi:lanthionine synthetase LanC family protein [Dyadobacter crusticola]|uniref:lanthionine synthetase LanC family protein n=1 Tax=Dyadobacter crusticola TaxID=292407 RepID=UPI000AE50061|nr:lanthionine synthetase LanC family protein [Dyadobacter crusticola]
MTLSGTSGLSVELATGKISEICDTVSTHQEQLTSFGFSRGYLGVSVFNYLYALHSGDQNYVVKARRSFDQACDMIDGDPDKSYPQDFAELGAVVHYLYEAKVIDLEPNVFLGDVDTILLHKMRFELSQRNIGGFVNGALGYGLYFLQRCRYDYEQFQPIVAELIQGILQCAVHVQNGCYWISRLMPKKETTYLSMPHGSAAILLFFAKAVEMNLFSADALRDITRKAIVYLKAHETHDKHYHFIDIVQEPNKSRLALCYGDMGIGYMLLRAGMAFRNETWRQEGLTLLRNCATRRSQPETGVLDASILFGATGLALMFDRIAQITGESVMTEAAEFWYNEILKCGNAEDGYAGFKAAYNQWHTHTNLAFSEGVIGVGCGLIKGVNPGKVNFDDLIWLF